MNDRALVDTNILFYYISAEDTKRHELAKIFMEKVRKNPLQFVITFQNLRELTASLIKRTKLSSEKINELVNEFQYLFGNVLYSNSMDLHLACNLARKHHTSFYDSLIVATATRYNVEIIYTENTRDFEKIPGINTVNPLL